MLRPRMQNNYYPLTSILEGLRAFYTSSPPVRVVEKRKLSTNGFGYMKTRFWAYCRVTGEVIGTLKLPSKAGGASNAWIALVVHPPAVAQDALARAAGESVLLVSARRLALRVIVRPSLAQLLAGGSFRSNILFRTC
jgi:hypothetical protein